MSLINKIKEWKKKEDERRANAPVNVIKRTESWKNFEKAETEKAMRNVYKRQIRDKIQGQMAGAGTTGLGSLRSNPIVRSLARSGDDFVRGGTTWGNPKAEALSSLLGSGRIEGKSASGMNDNGLSNFLNQGSIFGTQKKKANNQ